MKWHLIAFVCVCAGLFVGSCNSKQPTQALIPIVAKADTRIQNSVLEKPVRNNRDTADRKQGTWDHYNQGHLTGFETYKNDTLHGPFSFWINYPEQICTGMYTNGKPDSIWKYFEQDTILVMVVKHNNGQKVWMGFPTADYNMPVPVKSFELIPDTVFVNCPHANDSPWYKGLFIHKKPVGVHTTFYKKGGKKYEHNYNTHTISYYDKTGKLTKQQTEKEYFSGSQ